MQWHDYGPVSYTHLDVYKRQAFDDAVRAGITAAMIGPGSSNVVGGQFAMVKTKGRRIDVYKRQT